MIYSYTWATNEIVRILSNNREHYDTIKYFDYAGQFEKYCEENSDENLNKSRFDTLWAGIDWEYIKEYIKEYSTEEEL
tara:strand:+ start:1509 stop:1742 length:234 start_codon:yes stop_codon:yes gene_type:complete